MKRPTWTPECALDHLRAAGQLKRVLAGDTRWAPGDREIIASIAEILELTSEETHELGLRIRRTT